jgi:DNA-binding GntR family transcriptional regulator
MRFAKLFDWDRVKTSVIKELLEEKGIYESERQEWLEVGGTNFEESKKLEAAESTPAFIIEEVRKDAEGTPFYFTRLVRVGDSLRLEFSIN